MSDLSRQNPVYPIGVVQKLTGLTGRRIRYYEKQGLILPHRTKGNQRMYTDEEVDRLLQIKHLREQGYKIDGIKRALGSDRTPKEQKTKISVGPEPETEDQPILGRPERPTKLTSLYPINNRSELERLLRNFPE